MLNDIRWNNTTLYSVSIGKTIKDSARELSKDGRFSRMVPSLELTPFFSKLVYLIAGSIYPAYFISQTPKNVKVYKAIGDIEIFQKKNVVSVKSENCFVYTEYYEPIAHPKLKKPPPIAKKPKRQSYSKHIPYEEPIVLRRSTRIKTAPERYIEEPSKQKITRKIVIREEKPFKKSRIVYDDVLESPAKTKNDVKIKVVEQIALEPIKEIISPKETALAKVAIEENKVTNTSITAFKEGDFYADFSFYQQAMIERMVGAMKEYPDGDDYYRWWYKIHGCLAESRNESKNKAFWFWPLNNKESIGMFLKQVRECYPSAWISFGGR